jgi:hypothetical protein
MAAPFWVGVNKKDSTPDEIALDILERFDHSSRYITNIRDQHARNLKAYYGIPEDLPSHLKDSGASNLFIPLIEPLVDTNTSKAFMTILSHNPFIKYVSEHPDGELSARIMERIVKYMIVDKMPDGLTQLELWIRKACLDGTGILHVFHDKVTRTRSVAKPVMHPQIPGVVALNPDGTPLLERGVETVTDYSGLRFEVLDLFNFAADWNVMDIRDGWCAAREFIDPETYIGRVESLGYPDIGQEGLEALIDSNIADRSRIYNWILANQYLREDKYRQKIELVHYYGKAWLDGVRQDCMVTIARNGVKGNTTTGGGRLLRIIPFGVKPFCILRFKSKEGQLLGRGMADQIYDLQVEKNVTRNQRVDNISFELNGGWIYSDGAIEDEKELNSRPNQTIKKLDQTATLQKIERQALPPDAFAHEQTIEQEAMRVTASTDIMRGQMSRQETATTATLMNNNAGQRMESMVFQMGNSGFRMLGNLMKILISEYFPATEPVILKLSKNEIESFIEEVGPEDPRLQGILDPKTGVIKVSPMALQHAMFATTSISALEGDNLAKSQTLLQLLQILQPYSQVGFKDKHGNINYPDIWYIIRELARLNKFNDFRDMIVKIPAEVVAQQEAQKQALLAQAQNSQQPQSSPSEVAGQTGVPPVEEKYNQQQATIEMIDSAIANGG